jgi:hypothetical protein
MGQTLSKGTKSTLPLPPSTSSPSASEGASADNVVSMKRGAGGTPGGVIGTTPKEQHGACGSFMCWFTPAEEFCAQPVFGNVVELAQA